MSKLSSFFKDSVIYGIGNSLQKFISLMLIPIFTRVLSPEEYGVLSTLSTITYFISALAGLGLISATSRYFFKAETSDEKSKVLSTSIFLRLGATGSVTLLMLLIASQISVLLFDTEQWKWVVVVSLLLLPITQVSEVFESTFRYYRSAWKYLIVTVIRALINPGLAIFFVLVMQYGVLGIKMASLISAIITMVIAYVIFARHKISWKYDKKWAKLMLVFGFPLIWTSMLTWVNSVSDKLIILKLDDLSSVGLYSIGQSFSQPGLFISIAMQMSAYVLLMSTYAEDKDPEKKITKKAVNQYWKSYLLLAMPATMFLSVFSLDILKIFTTPAYYSGAIVIPFLTMGIVLNQSQAIVGIGMEFVEKTKPFLWIMLVASTINVVLNIVFIPIYGYAVAAVTTLLSSFINFQLTYLMAQKYFYIKSNIISILLYWMLSVGLCVLVPCIEFFNIAEVSFYIKVILFLFGLTLPILTGIISIIQIRNQLSKLIIKIKRQ
jgi:O-antigen/teichoic acid export membrane protein